MLSTSGSLDDSRLFPGDWGGLEFRRGVLKGCGRTDSEALIAPAGRVAGWPERVNGRRQMIRFWRNHLVSIDLATRNYIRALSLRFDVLVEPEEVVWIVAAL